MGDSKCRKQETGNRKQETENRNRNREQGTANRIGVVLSVSC
jgi:hypothetical protein